MFLPIEGVDGDSTDGGRFVTMSLPLLTNIVVESESSQRWWALFQGRRHFSITKRIFFPFTFLNFNSVHILSLKWSAGPEERVGRDSITTKCVLGNPLQHLIKACSPLSARSVPPGERGREPFAVSGIICIIQQLFSSDAYHTGLGYKDVRVESPRFRHLCSLFSWEPLRLFLYKCIRLWLSSLWT